MGPPLRLWAQPGISLPLRRRDAWATILQVRRLGQSQAGCLCYRTTGRRPMLPSIIEVGGEGLGEGVGASGP